MTGPRAEHPDERRRSRLLPAAPWLFVLVAVGAVQVVRAQWVDAAMFLVVAIALLLDAGGWLPARGARAVGGLPRAFVWPVAAVGALVLTIVPRHGVIGGIAALALGVAAVAVAWSPTPAAKTDAATRTARRPARVRGGLLWAGVAIATCVWELVVFAVGRLAPEARPAFPSISEIVDPVLDTVVGRGAFVVVWIGFGLFLLTRARPERIGDARGTASGRVRTGRAGAREASGRGASGRGASDHDATEEGR